MNDSLKWLHLSDFHSGKDDYAQIQLFKHINDKVLDKLRNHQIPDFIFITGDIANKGKKTEYDLFLSEFINPLLINLTQNGFKGKIFLVPGNHDVDRNEACSIQRYGILNRVPYFLDPTENGNKERKALHPRFKAFSDFSSSLNFTEWLFSNEATLIDNVNTNNKNVGIVCLNSSWLSEGEEDRHKLSFGKDILDNSLEKIKNCDIKIVLAHHPIDWLIDKETVPIRTLLGRHQAIYLYGHLHKTGFRWSSSAGDNFFEIQAGSCFTVREGEKWANCIIWAELVYDTNEIMLEPLTWNNDFQEWTLDTFALPERFRSNDKYILSLPKQEIKVIKDPIKKKEDENISFFVNRISSIGVFREFLRDPNRKLFLLIGLKGIGKTKFVNKVFETELPKISKINIQLTSTHNFGQLLLELLNSIGINFTTGELEAFDEEKYTRYILDFVEQFYKLDATVLIIEDFHYLYSRNTVKENYTNDLLTLLLSKTTTSNNRIIITSDLNFDLPAKVIDKTLTHRLNKMRDDHIKEIITYYVKSLDSKWAITPPEIPNEIIEMTVGHPLAARLLSEWFVKFSPVDIIKNVGIYRKFHSRLIGVILEGCSLTKEEKAFLTYASIFRKPVELDAFFKWGNPEQVIDLLESLTSNFFIDIEDGKYIVHKLFSDYFLFYLNESEKKRYHQLADSYYTELISSMGVYKNPSYLAEKYHHLSLTGDIDKASDIPKLYGNSLINVAKQSMENHDYDSAIIYLNMIVNKNPKHYNIHEVYFLLAKAYASKSIYGTGTFFWKEADNFFVLAVKILRSSYYYQYYAYLNIKGRRFRDAEIYISQALEIDQNSPENYTTLAILKYKQRDRDIDGAIKNFQKAKSINEENRFYLTEYIIFLIVQGDPNVEDVFKKALDLYSFDGRLKKLFSSYTAKQPIELEVENETEEYDETDEED